MSDAAIDKAVVLARGLGTRMRKDDDAARLTATQAAVAKTGLKAMIPIDRPFLDYVLSALADAGYRRICLVIGPEHDELRTYYTRTVQLRRITVEFAVQVEPLGTADAVASAERFADGESFLCINSDNYYPPEAIEALRRLDGPGLAAFTRKGMLAEGNVPPDRLARFAVIETDSDGCMTRIIEKPSAETIASMSEPVCVSMNCWRFSPAIFEACRSIGPSARGELEIPDAVQYAIDTLGERFAAPVFELPVLDLSSRGDVASMAARLTGIEVRL